MQPFFVHDARFCICCGILHISHQGEIKLCGIMHVVYLYGVFRGNYCEICAIFHFYTQHAEFRTIKFRPNTQNTYKELMRWQPLTTTITLSSSKTHKQPCDKTTSSCYS